MSFTYGNSWREQLVLPNGQSESLSDMVSRLATSGDDRDRSALIWLLTKLYQTVTPPRSDILEPIATALEELTGLTVERGLALEQLVPKGTGFTRHHVPGKGCRSRTIGRHRSEPGRLPAAGEWQVRAGC